MVMALMMAVVVFVDAAVWCYAGIGVDVDVGVYVVVNVGDAVNCVVDD